MSSSAPTGPWSDFTQDPRRPQAAGLRASDRDRDVVLGVLAEGYADGRLTRDEHDERADVAAAAKTLGDLPPLILDLVPEAPGDGSDLARATPDALQQRAVQHWESQRRQAVTGFLIPTVICWAIWVFTSLGDGGTWDPYFPWPIFVMLGSLANLIRVTVNRTDIVAEEQRRLVKLQRRALKERRPGNEPDDA